MPRKETPRKRPRAPPNSLIKESMGNTKTWSSKTLSKVRERKKQDLLLLHDVRGDKVEHELV